MTPPTPLPRKITSALNKRHLSNKQKLRNVVRAKKK